MKQDVFINNGITIPGNELEITVSRASGAGGQHVNKTDTKVTIRWNIQQTNVLDQAQKERVMTNLQARLTAEGDLIVHNSASRSQQQNKESALSQLAQIVRKALYVPKKRMKTKVPTRAREARLQSKAQRSLVKKMRSKDF